MSPPQSPPQSYQHPPAQGPPQYQHTQTTVTGSIVNPSLSGQPQRHTQSPARGLSQNIWGTGEKSQSSVQVQGVVTAQPEPVKGMECAEMSEEERKKQRRAEQLRKTRHCCGQTCIICGKVCVVTWSVMAAVCSVVACLVSCLPGDSPGMMGGGGGGFSISMPTD
jgi:hypothetical protein